MTNQIEIMRLLLNDKRLSFQKLRTVGEAITAVLETPEMANSALELAFEHEWICTRHIDSTISIETSHPVITTQISPAKFYHMSETSYRQSILNDGLKPQAGSKTSLQRKYSPRLHLAATLRDAFQFLHHQMKSLQNGSAVTIREIDEFDLYEVPVATGFEYHNDDHFDGRGLWIDTVIPASEIKLLERDDWHPLYRAMYPENFDPE